MSPSAVTSRLLLLLATALVVAACQGPPAPLSAQQGSSILIPVGGVTVIAMDLIGYGRDAVPGSAAAVDGQRGKLVFRLDDASGMILPTRATTLVESARQSKSGRVGFTYTDAKMVVSLIDIPVAAPVGTHAIYITRERGSSIDEIPYGGEIKILPHTITVDDGQGHVEDVTGTPSTFTGGSTPGGDFFPLGTFVPEMVPDPQLVLRPSVISAHAMTIYLSYPPAVVDVLDVYEPVQSNRGDSHPAMVSFKDYPTSGTLVVTAISASALSIGDLAVTFKLDNQSTPLDPEQVIVLPGLVTDQNGTSISGVTFTRWVE